ncbi:hypothetical protein NVP1076O_33 [Vibrio phage 1.076.O._10N.286.51.B7]|nr:hypothetical protein NVP1076O_33 [Vibrio phage 1.076.O._10N.286.51.B7]
MAINITQVAKDAEEARGVITDDVTLGGDLSGTLPNPDVGSLQGLAIPTSGFADGLGLRIESGAFVLKSLLDENSTFGGDVSGNQASGLSVGAVDGETFELAGAADGEIIKRVGGMFVNAADSAGGLSIIVADNANVTATSNSIVLVNTVTSAVTVTTPATPSDGDFFFLKDSHGAFLTNNCSVAGTVEGDTGGAILAANNMLMMFQYNGTDWRYSVLYLGH